jgi:hypothetical protein
MEFTRRNILALGSGAFAAASFAGMPAFASKTDDAIAAFTGGAGVAEGGIELKMATLCRYQSSPPALCPSCFWQRATRHQRSQHLTSVRWRARGPARRGFVWQKPKTWLLWRKWKMAHSAKRVQL